jgi:hypothetical protein
MAQKQKLSLTGLPSTGLLRSDRVNHNLNVFELLYITSFGNVGKLVKFRVRNEQC